MKRTIPLIIVTLTGATTICGATAQHRTSGEHYHAMTDTVPSDSARMDSIFLDSIDADKYVTLGDLVVKGVKTAVITKQDTIEYNAGSYKTKINANVEDLLKKLPGVEVSDDGTIKSGGKTVTKILVNDKELFGEDTKMATKNLPSELVDKVQVIDRKSDFARLTGVDDGDDETVINLTVKKKMQNGWVGNIQAGYGTDNRYQGSFNLSTFSENNQVSIVGGANNTNELGFMDRGRGQFNSLGSNGGINSSQRLGVNFNLGKTNKFRVGGSLFYTHSDRHAISQSDVQYLFPDSTSYQKENSDTRDRGHNVNGNFHLKWEIDDNNTLDFRPQFSFNSRNASMTDTTELRAGDALRTMVNTNSNVRENQGTSWTASGNLIFNHKFASHPGRSLSLSARYRFSNTRQYTSSWNDIIYYLQQEDSELLDRYIDSRQWSNTISGRATWLEPLGNVKRGNFLELQYEIKYQWSNSDRWTYDMAPETDGGHRELLTDLSNRFRNTFETHQLKLGYKKVTSKMNLQAGVEFSPSRSKSRDLINAERNITTDWVYNIAPYLRFRYRFSKTMSLRADYRARTSSPSLTQLQPVADISDPLNIKVGNPDLKPTFTQNLMLNFNNFDQERQQSIAAMLHGSYSTNVVVSKSITDPNTGARTTTYANANGNTNIFGMFMINQPLRNRNWRWSANLNGSWSSIAGYINGDFNRSGNLNLTPELGMTFQCDLLSVSARPRYSFSMATNSLQSQPNRYTHSYGFRADATLTLPFGLELETDISWDKTTGYSAGFDSDTWLWNAQLSYSMLRDRSLTFSIQAYDLLGQRNNISRSVTAGQITDSRYNDLTRYVMFGVTWNFNTLKNKKRNDRPDGFDDMPPGPPPGMRNGRRGNMGPPPGGRPF